MNNKFCRTKRDRGNKWQCWHTSAVPADSAFCKCVRRCVCVCMLAGWRGLLFSQLSIHHSFIPGDIQQFWWREWQDKRGRWEKCGRWDKINAQKKRRWLVDFHTTQIPENRKTRWHVCTPQSYGRPPFRGSPPLKFGTGSRQQLLRVPHFTHVLCVWWLPKSAMLTHTDTQFKASPMLVACRYRMCTEEETGR